MGKISDYTRVLASKLADVFVVDQTDNGTTETKSATVEQIGTAIGTLQTFADLDTSNKNLVDAINEIASYTPVYGNTASGAIATFDTSLALPLQDCTIAINAVQESGTPTPSSPKAISGFTGANVTNHGKNYIDTSTNVNGKALSATGAETSIAQACYTDLIKVVVGEKYTFGATSALVDAWNRRIHGYDVSGNWVQEIMNSNAQSYAVGTPFTMTFTVPSGISFVRISYYKDTNAQLEKGESASAYQAYNSTTTAITWQSEAGTVYGGSLDVTSGVLTVDRASDIINNLNTNYYSAGSNHYLYATISDKYEPTSMSDMTHPLIFEMMSYGGVQYASGFTDMKCYQNVGKNIYIVDNSLSDKASFLTKYGTARIVWYLATPVTYQLTPTQISAIVGTNNIFTDTNGNTSVVYACSLKDYIDGQ